MGLLGRELVSEGISKGVRASCCGSCVWHSADGLPREVVASPAFKVERRRGLCEASSESAFATAVGAEGIGLSGISAVLPSPVPWLPRLRKKVTGEALRMLGAGSGSVTDALRLRGWKASDPARGLIVKASG